MTTRYTVIPSPVDDLVLTAADGRLAGVWFTPLEPGPDTRAGWDRDDDHPVLARARAQLEDYFAGRRREFDLPLAPRGTTFQLAVWEALRAIPYGTTVSYGQLARRIGAPTASRAVGAANGRNPLAVVVPCHRVVGAGGALTGYAGGMARKRALLDLEAGALVL